MKFNYMRVKYISALYFFIVSYGAALATYQPNLVGIPGNTMKITNGTSEAVTLVIERASAPHQQKEDEYDVINNLQPQATCTLPYEFVAVGDKKQQQVTGIFIFSVKGQSPKIPLGKVLKSKLPATAEAYTCPADGARIGIPVKANYILKTSDATVNQKKVSKYELYAQESKQTSPSHHRYFKVEPVSGKTYQISKDVGLVIQTTASH